MTRGSGSARHDERGPRFARHDERGPRFVRHDERGSGTMLALAVAVILTAVSALVAIAAGYLIADRRAAGAADLAALAAARAQVQGGDACAGARSAATSNQARVESCSVHGADPVWVAEVTVAVDVHPVVPGAPRTLRRTAWAGTPDADPGS